MHGNSARFLLYCQVTLGVTAVSAAFTNDFFVVMKADFQGKE
jgi:hypothetical protein